MKTSMYGTRTDTTDLREKEKNFLNFIVIDGEEKSHSVYPMIQMRCHIISFDDHRYSENDSCIRMKNKAFHDVHISVVHLQSNENIELFIQNSGNATIYVNGERLRDKQKIEVSSMQDFYISLSNQYGQCCVLGSTKDYSNRDWESFPLYDQLSSNKGTVIRIGRDKDNDICVDNHTVSREHGIFQLVGDKILFTERNVNQLGSKINGEPVKNMSCEVPDCSLLQLGTAVFLYVNRLLLYSPFNNGCELALEGVSKEVHPLFEKKKILLKDINMTIPGNSLVAVMGPSGAGKSTLIDLIRQNEKKNSGQIKLNGYEINHSPEIQRCMGYVHQNNLLRENLTVEETIFYYASVRVGDTVSKDQIHYRIKETLVHLNLSGHEKSKISVLSGGQKKKVAIACELVCDPQVLFLDEPTSGLDPSSEAEIMEILKKLTRDKKRGKTILVITHSLLHFDEFDKIVFIGKSKKDQTGYLCYYGTPQGLFSHFNVEDRCFAAVFEQAVLVPDVSANAYRRQYFGDLGGNTNV